MARKQITTIEGSAALLLADDVLSSLGIKIGDEVDITIGEGKLVLRSLSEVEREQKLESAVQDIFERRQSAFQELAEGAA